MGANHSKLISTNTIPSGDSHSTPRKNSSITHSKPIVFQNPAPISRSDHSESSGSSRSATPGSVSSDDFSILTPSILSDHSDLQVDHQSTSETNKASDMLVANPITIAILGNSGVGKSTLLNCLLDCPNLAEQGGYGKAVTSCPMEFLYLSGKDCGLHLEVEYHTKKEIEQVIQEHVWNLQPLPVASSSDPPKQGTKLENNYEEATAVLGAIFADHKDWKDECTGQKAYSYASAVSTMLQWFDDVELPPMFEDGTFLYHADDVEDCTDKLSELTSTNFWPFLKVIRIYLKSDMLKHGITLVDLPGLRDSNAARTKANQDYLAKTDHFLILADIQRAASNKSIQEAILLVTPRNYRKIENQGVALRQRFTIVCTKSDDMIIADMEKEFVNRCETIPRQIMDKLNSEIETTDSKRDSLLFETERRHLYMDARNVSVKSLLLKAHHLGKDSTSMEIFCVSSKEYNEGNLNQDAKQISRSQVPELRAHCVEIVSNYQLTGSKYAPLFPSLGTLKTTKLQIAAKPKVRHASGLKFFAIDRGIMVLQGLMEYEIKGAVGCLKTFLESMEANSSVKIPQWIKTALLKHSEWILWHWKTYDAFVREHGNFCNSRAVHAARWNHEMSEQMRIDLQGYWTAFKKLLLEVTDHLSTAVHYELDNLSTGHNCIFAQFKATKSWVQAFDSELQKIVRAALDQLEQLINQVIQDNDASFMSKEMHSAYVAAAEEKGDGKKGRQVGHILSKIQGPMFSDINEKFFDRLYQITSDFGDDLQKLEYKRKHAFKHDRKVLGMNN